jgi:hypothetical protein
MVNVDGESTSTAILRVHLKFASGLPLTVSAVVPRIETPAQHANHAESAGVLGMNVIDEFRMDAYEADVILSDADDTPIECNCAEAFGSTQSGA